MNMNTLSGTECTCKSATSRYGIISPLRAPSLEETEPIIPKWTVLQKALAEGECEFWDCLRPGFAPNPFLVLGWFLDLGVFVSSRRPRWRHCRFDLSMHNACIVRSEGERRKTRLPPFKIIIIATLGLLGF